MTDSQLIATVANLKPQGRIVYNHMREHGSISNLEALVVHGISRLAAVVYDLRQADINVHTDLKTDAAGHGYSRYSLAA